MGLKIIGTSHIAKQSVNEIKEAIQEGKPDLIALELDTQRAIAIFQKEKTKIGLAQIKMIGVKGYLFAKIGQYVQQKLGKMVRVAPGSEMKTALTLAKQNDIKVALIDQPIQITLKKFSQRLTWKEKFRFLTDAIKGLIFPKKQLQELGLNKFDLRKVPKKEFIIKMMKMLQQRYPSIYKTLVADRNKYMVKKLVKLLREYSDKNILVIVGAGHVEGMNELLLKVDVVKS